MAEEDSSIGFESSSDNGPDDSLRLRKRARRRLVGAMALALFAVIVLPMVMDQEPQPLNQDIEIRIPNRDEGVSTFVAKSAPSSPASETDHVIPPSADPVMPDTGMVVASQKVVTATPLVAAKPESRVGSKSDAALAAPLQPMVVPENKPESKSDPGNVPDKRMPEKSVDPVVDKRAESARAAAILNDEHWVIQLGAYQDVANAKAIAGRIKSLGLPAFTETIETPQGPRTRVRSGPFGSRGLAEKAQINLKKASIGAPMGGVVVQAQ